MPSDARVRQWTVEDSQFGAEYARARDAGLDHHAELVLEVADNSTGDPARDRLRFDARRWYLSKLAPKKYGDKLDVSGTTEVRLSVIERRIVDPRLVAPELRESLRALVSQAQEEAVEGEFRVKDDET